ncbi:MATE family efflux transporter [Anaerocolumna jejuensis]|uniref:MATE family efflux transporter n=1 Tax=Anaerocolumna jejuensis TaxID=259063 RepID=UPI003F7C6B63
MALFSYDKQLNKIETPLGTITLSSLFFPFFIEMILVNTMGTINTISLSRYSSGAVAAVGAASQVMNMIYTFYGVVSAGSSIVISQNLGAGKKERAADSSVISILFSASFSIILGIALALAAAPLLSLMHLKGELLGQAVLYFRICVSFSCFQAVYSALSSIFRSYGKPKTAVKISLLVNFTNAFINILIVFRPFDIPLQGVSGIATSSVISQSLGMSLMFLLLKRSSFFPPFRKGILKQLHLIKKVLYIGVPGGLTNLSYSLSQVVSTSIVASMGTTAMTTKIYLDNIFFYVYVVGLALGQSTSLIISRLAGARKYTQAQKLNKQNLQITLLCNIVLSLVIYLAGRQLLGMFTDDPAIISAGHKIMLFDIFVEIGRGFNHIENNSLRGAGDVFFPMMVSLASCWTVSILFSYLLGIVFGLGLAGCWIAFAMDELFRGITYYLRFKSGKWKAKTIV